MARTNWRIESREVEQNLIKAAKMFGPDEVEGISEEGAKIISKEAETRTPIGPTGRLRSAHVVKKLGRRMGRAAPVIAAVDRKIAPHAWLVEYGKYKNPYFRPALEAKREEVARLQRDRLRRIVERGVR